MYRTALRVAPRRIVSSSSSLRTSNRFISTASPPKKSRSWKGAALRWGLAVAGVYYYNTSNVFAEEPEGAIQRLDDSLHHIQESSLPTVDAVVEEKKRRLAEQVAEDERKQQEAEVTAAVDHEVGDGAEAGEGHLEGLEEEADQQGAFNPETGEINWDCPCLGGMAHGPCGEEFKAAFSCFVYSKEEPKGVECIEKFKGMQDCFRQHPEMYGSELDDDEDEVEEELRARESTSASNDAPQHSPQAGAEAPEEAPSKTTETKTEQTKLVEVHKDSQSTPAVTAQKSGDEEGELLPKAVHDATAK